ncbi:MAG: hypothetical protein WBW94_16855 [Anaerolineales bacterium]
MDEITNKAIQDAIELLRLGKHQEAQNILAPLIRNNPNDAQAWYLLGFTLSDVEKRIYAFQQVLRIDPSNQKAKEQIAILRPTTFTVPDQENRPTSTSTKQEKVKEPKRVGKSRNFPIVLIAIIGAVLIFCALGIGAWAFFKDRFPGNLVSNNIVSSTNSTECPNAVLQKFMALQDPEKTTITALTEMVWKDARECNTNNYLCENSTWSILPTQGANGCNIYYSILVDGQKETVLMYYLDLSNSRVYAGSDPNNFSAPSWVILNSEISNNGYFDLSK